MLKQDVTPVTVEFEDTAVADFLEDMVERGLQPHQFMRVWIHTHPNMNPTPSSVDEETFERVFGDCDYAIMFILSTKDTCYCRIQTNVGISTEQKIDAAVDYSTSFGPSDEEAWKKEFDDSVNSCGGYPGYPGYGNNNGFFGDWDSSPARESRWANTSGWSAGSSWATEPSEPVSSEKLKEVNGPEFFSLLSDEEICATEDSLKCEYKEDPDLWDLAASVMFHDDITDIEEVEDNTLLLLVKEHIRGPELAALLDVDILVGYEDDDDDDGYMGGFSSDSGGDLTAGFVPEAGDSVKILPAVEVT